jgi:hypothetical protein
MSVQSIVIEVGLANGNEEAIAPWTTVAEVAAEHAADRPPAAPDQPHDRRLLREARPHLRPPPLDAQPTPSPDR